MGLQYKVESRKNYLLMSCKGVCEASMAGDFTNQIVNACQTYQPTKFLIDLRKLRGDMNTLERFNLSVLAAKKYFIETTRGRIPKCRFALVGKRPLLDPDKFGESVAVNRGLNTHTFSDVKKAIAWLK